MTLPAFETVWEDADYIDKTPTGNPKYFAGIWYYIGIQEYIKNKNKQEVKQNEPKRTSKPVRTKQHKKRQ